MHLLARGDEVQLTESATDRAIDTLGWSDAQATDTGTVEHVTVHGVYVRWDEDGRVTLVQARDLELSFRVEQRRQMEE